jgi:hypothetical protein
VEKVRKWRKREEEDEDRPIQGTKQTTQSQRDFSIACRPPYIFSVFFYLNIFLLACNNID